MVASYDLSDLNDQVCGRARNAAFKIFLRTKFDNGVISLPGHCSLVSSAIVFADDDCAANQKFWGNAKCRFFKRLGD